MKERFIIAKWNDENEKEYFINSYGLTSYDIDYATRFSTYPEAQAKIAEIIKEGEVYQIEKIFTK